MSRQLRAVLALTGGVAVAFVASATRAAPASDVFSRDAGQNIFVDLTAGANAPAAPAPGPSVAVPAGTPAAMFVDLTKGDSPVLMPERAIPPSRTPRLRHVDLSGGAAPPPDIVDENGELQPDTITITAEQPNDPYEEANRGRFRTHVALHRYVIDPVERTYFAIVPVPARTGLHNFLTNLETPEAFANDLFQGDVDRAGNTLSRFVVNTTLGIGGIFDIAGMAGIPYRDDDFGATLATYGVSDYPYLLVPVIGPSNPRDLTGKVVDFLLNPLRWVTLPGGILTSVAHAGFHELDKRSLDVGELVELSGSAPDAYAVERSRARARRAAEISGAPIPPP